MSELSMRVRGFAYDLHSVADCVEALEAEVERLKGHRADEARWHADCADEVERLRARIPDPDDLRLVLDAAEYVVKEYDTGPEPDMLAAAIASLRATLEEA
jgi:hypothetical protein